MGKTKILLLAVAALALIALFWRPASHPSVKSLSQTETSAAEVGGLSGTVMSTSMKIESGAFAQMGVIPAQYTCDSAQAVNPPLSFSDVPEGTRSLALVMDDPDVPANVRPDGLFVHWVMWNIDPEIRMIPEDSTPTDAVAGQGTSGRNGYVGPCPPDREHRYFFRLYALDTRLDLPATAVKADLESAMQGHILGNAELVGRYDRPNR